MQNLLQNFMHHCFIKDAVIVNRQLCGTWRWYPSETQALSVHNEGGENNKDSPGIIKEHSSRTTTLDMQATEPAQIMLHLNKMNQEVVITRVYPDPMSKGFRLFHSRNQVTIIPKEFHRLSCKIFPDYSTPNGERYFSFLRNKINQGFKIRQLHKRGLLHPRLPIQGKGRPGAYSRIPNQPSSCDNCLQDIKPGLL